MNCHPILHKCKAECCGPCPIPAPLYRRHRHRVAHEPAHEVLDGDGYMLAVDANGMCVFLGDDYRCAIYDDRPPVCRLFGTGCHPLMECIWQAPDGRERGRVERRQMERRLGPVIDRFLGTDRPREVRP
jgi:Fe-S-cluster containining protein